MGNQFANLILEGKEWIRKRGEHFERSQQAHVIKARLSELQSARRVVIRRVGQQVAQIVVDVEDVVIAKTRRALFGDDFASYYELCKNRLIFLDGGKDDVFFLEHYVLLGNYARDPDRFEATDALFQEFIREAGVTLAHDPAHAEAIQVHTALLESVQTIRTDIATLEEQRGSTRKRLERGDSFLTKFLSSGDPADLKASLNDVEQRLKHQECKLEEMGPQIDSARQKLDFFVKDHAGKLGEYLNEPENAKRLFDASSAQRPKLPIVRACSYNSSNVSNSTKLSFIFWPATRFVPSPTITARPCTCSNFAKPWFPGADQPARRAPARRANRVARSGHRRLGALAAGARARYGATVLLASHNMAEVERLCERVIMMKRGRIEDDDAPQRLLTRYGRQTLEEVFLDVARGRGEAREAAQ